MSESLVEYFGDMYNWKVDDMRLALECSDIKKDEYIPNYPTYTFSDDSYIMFHGKDYTISYVK